MEVDVHDEDADIIAIGRRRMKELYQMAHDLLSRPERLILYKVLKDYRQRRDLVRLVIGLNLVLRTYSKLELLKYVRYFIWKGHVKDFDRLTKFHSKFRRRREDTLNSLSELYVPLPFEHRSHRSVASTSTNPSTSRQFKDVRVFTIHRDRHEPNLGFSVRGGAEHGLSIYVSEIDEGSAAEKSGLQVGDKILEVNNISLRGVASSSAVKLLTGSNRLKLVVQRTRKVPEWRLSREKTSWYDVMERKLISGEFEECGISHHIRGLDVDVPERRINLKFGRSDKTLGFNIRGGREYGLGIYVSRIDRDGLADKNGVHVGDQIIDVNGVPFDNITHAHAVEVMKGKRHLILTLRDVGRFPVFKELYAEYTWSDGLLKPASSTTSLKDIHVVHPDLPNKSPSLADLFSSSKLPSALQTEIFLPNQRTPARSSKNEDSFVARSRHSNGHGDDDDTESLIDLEQWAMDIRNDNVAGRDNHGYVSEDNLSDAGADSQVIVHIHKADSIEVESYPLVGSSQNNERAGCSVKQKTERSVESEYDTPDMIYAKINKQNNRYGSSSNVSLKVPSEEDVAHLHRSGSNDNVSNASSRRGSLLGFGDTEPQASSSQAYVNEETVSTASIDGALYSKVRPLSGSRSPYGSTYNLHDVLLDDPSAVGASYGVPSGNAYNGKPDDSDRDSDNDSVTEGGFDVTCSGTEQRTHVSYMVDSTERSGMTKPNSAGGDIDLNTLEERLKELQKRQTSIGFSEIETLSPKEEQGPSSAGGTLSKKQGKWKSFKKKIKGSLRLKSPKRLTISQKGNEDEASRSNVRKSGIKSKIDPINMATLEEEAQKLLNEDEFNAVFRHIKTYHDAMDLGRLVDVLVTILDKPEKLQLLKDVRGVVYQHDIVQYDNLVNKYEIEAYQKLSMKLHLPLNHRLNKKPRKTLITTEMEDTSDRTESDTNVTDGGAEDGHFHIKSMEQSAKEKEIVDIMQEGRDQDKGKQPMSPNKGKQPMSPRRTVKIAEEESALDHFEYLEFEHSEEGSSIAAFSDYSSHTSSELERIPGSVVVHLSKTKPSVGIDFEEQYVHGQNEVRVAAIDPNGAANDDSTIEVGMTLLAVDRQKVDGFSKEEVLAVIEKSYMDKHRVSMKLLLHREESTNF